MAAALAAGALVIAAGAVAAAAAAAGGADRRAAWDGPGSGIGGGGQCMGAMASAPSVRATTWNVAAVNNNPFEYWITHPDAEYAALMGAVEAFIDAPAERDLPVREVLTSEMVARLVEAMRARGWVGVEETAAAWDADFSQRRIISGFLKDKTLGSKRLASMPDRVTNTIGLADGTTACRPAVINMYEVRER